MKTRMCALNIMKILVNMFAVSFSWAPPKSSKNTIRLSPSVAPWSLIRVGMTESTTCAGPRQWPIHYCCHTSRCGRGRRGGHRDENHKLHQCLADGSQFLTIEKDTKYLYIDMKYWFKSDDSYSGIAITCAAICVDACFVAMPVHAACENGILMDLFSMCDVM